MVCNTCNTNKVSFSLSPMGINMSTSGLPCRLETNTQIVDYYHTDVFTNFEGTDIPTYNNLKDIPDNLNNGQQVMLTEEGFPPNKNFSYATVHATQDAATNGLIPPIWIVIILVTLTISLHYIIMEFRSWAKATKAPCGESLHEEQIDDCLKLITYPNCDGVAYNTCTNEIVDEWTAPQGLIENLTKLLIIGGMFAVGIYLLKFPKAKHKEKNNE